MFDAHVLMLMREVLVRFHEANRSGVSDGLERFLVPAAHEPVGAKDLAHLEVPNVDWRYFGNESRQLARRRVVLGTDKVGSCKIGAGGKAFTEHSDDVGFGCSVAPYGVADDVVVEDAKNGDLPRGERVRVVIRAPQAELF